MTENLQKQINKETKQKYLAHPFNLCNLLQTFHAPPIFTIAVSQIFTTQNKSENMTFGVQIYGVKLFKSKQNILRILYYSLLCYLFQLKEHFLTAALKNKFILYVLNNLKTILPAKYEAEYYLRLQKKPFLTTSQIKSCFMKFMHILQKKPKQCKMIIEQLNSLPQMDFIFISIFKSLVNIKWDKNGLIVLQENELVNLQQKIGFNFKFEGEQIIIQNQFRIKLIDKSLQIQQFVIEKYVQPKKDSVINSKLKRKQTTQSVGQIDQEQTSKSTQNCLEHHDPFNAKLVISQSTDQLDNEIKQINQLKQYINQNNIFDDEIPFKVQQSRTQKPHFGSFKINPFSKKENYQAKIQKNQPLIIKKNVDKIYIKHRYSQIPRERSFSKSLNKLSKNKYTQATSNFRSFWKANNKIKTQQSQNYEIYQPFGLQRQLGHENTPFCLSRQNTFGNPKAIYLFQNNIQKENNVNKNILNQINSLGSSPRVQRDKLNKKQGQCYTSICSKFNSNNGISHLNQFRVQNSTKHFIGHDNKKYSFQIQFNPAQQKVEKHFLSPFAK